VVYTHSDEQTSAVTDSMARYQAALGSHPITTEIAPAGNFYFAEDYHQQYLAKNPDGYCGLGGTGICMPPQFK
ncbi:peptide-methionine (S)-S-oxide reductase, partial [Vibrio natriegens]